jgi:hypothetical protein
MALVTTRRSRLTAVLAALAALVVPALLVMATGAHAGETIETSSFALTLPDRWTPDLTTQPISARGPAGELLQVSSSTLAGEGPAEETAGIMRQVEDAATRSMRKVEADPTLTTVTPISKRPLPGGGTMHEMLSRTRDGQSLFAQFCATGPRTVVLVTVQLPAAAGRSVDAIRQSVLRLRWVR